MQILVPVAMARYNFDIFQEQIVRTDRLDGTVYRYWSTYAIAHVLRKSLHGGRIDFLDAGGRDGGTARLLEEMGFSGRYTCLDLAPVIHMISTDKIKIEYHESDFKSYNPTSLYDAVLFEGSLEFVDDYRDISWLQSALKPNGCIIVTLLTRNAYHLYHGFYANGGRYYLNEEELLGAFGEIGLRPVETIPLVGLAGRLVQYLIQRNHFYAAGRRISGAIYHWTGGRMSFDPAAGISRQLNRLSVFSDRLTPLWPVGHLIVLRRQTERNHQQSEGLYATRSNAQKALD
jgi:SAM-dependent methyltransferase